MASSPLPPSPPLSPLPPGTPVPEIALTAAGRTVSPDTLRGQTTVLLFASPEWNPAQAEQMTQFYNALVQSARPGESAGSDSLTRASLVGMRPEAEGMAYDLHFDGDAEPVRIVVLPDIDNRSEAAHAYGVYDRQAVFAVDSGGIIRFRHVTETGMGNGNAAPRIGALVDSLREIHTLPETDAPRSVWQASRRDFIAAALAGAFALTLGTQSAAEAARAIPDAGHAPAPAGTIPVRLKVNGKTHALNLDPRVALLDALRETIGLTGSKKGCDHGQCGACTVHIDGHPALSCLSLAAQQEGSEIVTIEGLAKGDSLHPVQQAFLDHDGYQCGYCTPGQIMSAVGLIREGRAKTDPEIREGMSGNLCRCAAYPHIVEAVKAARDSGKRV